MVDWSSSTKETRSVPFLNLWCSFSNLKSLIEPRHVDSVQLAQVGSKHILSIYLYISNILGGIISSFLFIQRDTEMVMIRPIIFFFLF